MPPHGGIEWHLVYKDSVFLCPNFKAGVVQKKVFWLNFWVVFFVAINLRAPITSMGPMVDSIKEFFGVDSAQVGLLGSIVLGAFGLVSFVAIYLHPIRGIFIGIVCVILGEMVRSYLGLLSAGLALLGLFGGTMLMGAGIAIVNVLLPSFIRAKFTDKIPLMMGVYSLVVGISAMLGIVLALPLLKIIGLPSTMAFWAIFGVVALVVFYPQIKNNRLLRKAYKPEGIFRLFGKLDAWKITIFMGLQSLISYSVFAWYPKMVAERGFSLEVGADMTLLMQLITIPSALLTPLLIAKVRNRYKIALLLLLCGFYVAGFGVFLWSEGRGGLVVASLLCGVPMGGAFSLALFLISAKASSLQTSGQLSAMSQGFGYLIASLGPYLVGRLHDIFGGFGAGIGFLLGAIVCLGVMGVLGLRAQRV